MEEISDRLRKLADKIDDGEVIVDKSEGKPVTREKKYAHSGIVDTQIIGYDFHIRVRHTDD